MIQTVIFDMDGVIVDTEPVHRYAYFKQFNELNITVTEEMYTSFTGFSTRNTFQKLKEVFVIEHEVEDLIQRKRNIFNEAFDSKADLELLEGVESFIKELHQNGMQLILASSASKVTIERVFNRFKLHDYFTHVVSGEDFPKSKPHPAIFEHAASLSIASKESCIVIEDSTNGIKAAKAAGIFCVGYNSIHSEAQDLSEADVVINHFNELGFEMLKDIQSKLRNN
ncbi:HAD family hydrolase [Flavobacterium xueshanense]|uniref:Haloacid dehalogenase superfamily, subfamily IA, variant 3 with third motif having DD or ED/haloacid dehalogenase superfamily, subfamily IA, variant 1 with third motif having Dx(3-4)D or Dx(3-4)E n=1 Tax=Flavobacterium xueshanense TaxID=935223 RepID=A0A1I2GS74_9FLAO|nr:HAD family hydrolase [Flavobacterium xueshanense]SFF20784.1 haloacid dehalogenase superfamily, subfamily IA, variant 3 with third motif having DD or ED/haloacid dehalogenase superfamily, subfamily IA, variant 1 with third motif having Dx(3-4)D or Dx(3-4)E [Flavobacterium xueshanense]